jgi:hypothetical protein
VATKTYFARIHNVISSPVEHSLIGEIQRLLSCVLAKLVTFGLVIIRRIITSKVYAGWAMAYPAPQPCIVVVRSLKKKMHSVVLVKKT